MEILKSKMVTKVSCGSELLAKLLARPDLRDVTVNLKDQNGWTPLMFAVQLNSTRFVRLMMMDKRVEANIRDNQGNSPLMAAVKLNHVQCVKAILTDARADLSGRDNFSISDKDASRYTCTLAQDYIIILYKDIDIDSILISKVRLHNSFCSRKY